MKERGNNADIQGYMVFTSLAETIFATASPALKSGVAIIRISGDRAGAALMALTGKALPRPRMAKLVDLSDPQSKALLDKALILWFPAPHSFSGEDTAELHVHGSIAVIASLLDVLSRMDGLRLAEPGEFSKRAFEHQKMDLTEAEGLADLIEAETALQAKQALSQMQGGLHALYGEWRQQLIGIQAQLEAYIDFPDEDIPEDVIDAIAARHHNLLDELQRHLSDDGRGERLRRGLQVVIMGAPNAGKSSLLNILAKRDVAIVSDVAGTTRDVLDVHLDIGGYPVTISDTAGLREHAGAVEQEGIRRALKRAEEADLRLVMVDVTTSETSENQELVAQAGDDALIIFNKTDMLANKKNDGNQPNHLYISAKSQEGINVLLDTLKVHAQRLMGDGSADAPTLTRARHRQLLSQTFAALSEFSLEKDLTLAAEDLRHAANALGRIIGHIDVEDILDELFSQFCIGK